MREGAPTLAASFPRRAEGLGARQYSKVHSRLLQRAHCKGKGKDGKAAPPIKQHHHTGTGQGHRAPKGQREVSQISRWNGMEWNGMEWNGMELSIYLSFFFFFFFFSFLYF